MRSELVLLVSQNNVAVVRSESADKPDVDHWMILHDPCGGLIFELKSILSALIKCSGARQPIRTEICRITTTHQDPVQEENLNYGSCTARFTVLL